MLYFCLEPSLLLDRHQICTLPFPGVAKEASTTLTHPLAVDSVKFSSESLTILKMCMWYIACICSTSSLSWDSTDLNLALSQFKVSLLINEKWFHLSAEISSVPCICSICWIFSYVPILKKSPCAKSRLLPSKYECTSHLLHDAVTPELRQQKCHPGLHRSDLVTENVTVFEPSSF